MQQAQGEGTGRGELYVYMVTVADQMREALSLLWPADVAEGGLPRAAIAGIFAAPAPKHGRPPMSSFWTNPDFVDLVHEVVAQQAPHWDDIVAAAQAQGDGWVYVIDARAKPEGDAVPIQDIIGGFEVKGGGIAAESYRPNAEWALVDPRGQFRLPSLLLDAVMERLRHLAEAQVNAIS